MEDVKTTSLKELWDVDIRTVDINSLVDISTVRIDPRMAKADRVFSFIRQTHNPYCFRSGSIAVKTRYSETNATLEGLLAGLLEIK